MKKYKTESLEIRIRILKDCDGKTPVLNVQYAPDVGSGSEHEIVFSCEELIKKQLTDSAFTKHILSFFIKE